MAVRSSGEARQALQRLIGSARVPYATLLREGDLPGGLTVPDPAGGQRWLWSEPPPGTVGGYGDPETYALSGAPPQVWEPPHTVDGADDETCRSYMRHSVDLTMRGGTTSGVVYPLAVCEVASRFRVRNVGGASAGAIAAAVTAAAEVGRSSQLPAERYAPLSEEERQAGHVRPGFVGMSDTIAWLAEVSAEDLGGERDAYRLAQLFRPGPRDRRLYALVTAFMRKQVWAGALALVLAFGNWSKLLIATLIAAGLWLAAWVGARLPSWPAVDRPGGGHDWWRYAWAALDLYLFFNTVGALLVLAPMVLSRSSKPLPPRWLTLLTSVSSQHHTERRLLSLSFWRPLTAVAVLAVTAVFTWLRWWDWVAGALAGAILSLAMGAVVATSAWRYFATVGRRGFGLLAGSAPRTARRPSEFLAGAARPTVPRSVIPWLSDCLNEVAALDEGEVLRFGHLWQGRSFKPLAEATPDVLELAQDPQRRLVNLELITTDLSRQRPYRFPLTAADPGDPDADALYFRMEDLADGDDAVFPPDVIEAMRDPNPRTVPQTEHDAEPVTLHRLPDPWNLPVIFAVRLSLALPGLFKAIRLYRLAPATEIGDEFGRGIRDHARNRLMWPEDGKRRAQELWFSDGGITSNFPVHLFDSPLPRWPTFGLNLGQHPYQFPHQDVWLPQDWEQAVAPATDLGGGGARFLGSILDTARSWRDSMQTAMPGYRGRVAWVRQRTDEGGTNLYMPREIIASMALRGALAGARLTRRFGHEAQWDRHRWLRLRSTVDNLDELRGSVRGSMPYYADILAGREEFLRRAAVDYPYDPPGGVAATWFEPGDPAFWPAAGALLDNLTKGDAGEMLTRGSPRPQPDLRQVPPE
ncbi:patatin-like phospholipase family protein [Phytohabitans sp. ZYX-F-186]|uniref:Patatin-like phospholipase family protein n=1 Tax=Phytohabitans maris TaxID=3071409 RepID=A0ABU0ZEG3_9ACTN|nr:patatin-like phospholipase family protein [Phytohabitans sp. ZYX-F-186]MDQ7905427.1 patatin-like phospholipase family protein [Phytohabitans sp. ZYX-F-186]